nr:MAG TPA: hypothetical protein [Caudoviricetes sp.]
MYYPNTCLKKEQHFCPLEAMCPKKATFLSIIPEKRYSGVHSSLFTNNSSLFTFRYSLNYVRYFFTQIRA